MSTVKDSLDVLNRRYDICIIGEGNVGISSFLYSYIYRTYIDDTALEIEELLTKTVWRGSRSYDISILGGSATQEYYLSSRKQQIRNTTALIFAYSVADRQSFAELEDLFERTMFVRKDVPPFIIVGLRSDMDTERQVTYEEGYSLCKQLGGIKFQECSARDDVGIIEAFDPIIDAVLSIKYDKDKKKKGAIINKKGAKAKNASKATIPKAAVKLSKSTKNESRDEKKTEENEYRQSNLPLSTDTSLASESRTKNYSLLESKRGLQKQGCCTIT